MTETTTVTPDGISGVVSDKPNARAFVPFDGSFLGDDDFLKAPELQQIAEHLIATCGELDHLDGAPIRYRWKRKGGKSNGADVHGKCTRMSGALRHFSGAEFLIWIAADHVREAGYTNLQLEALMFHELLHIELRVNDDETSPDYGEERLVIRAHDAEVFLGELQRYGAWRSDHQALQEQYRQLSIAAGAAAA